MRKRVEVILLSFVIIGSRGRMEVRTHVRSRQGVGGGGGRTTQQLRALEALAEDQSFVPSTHMGQLTTTRNSSFRGSDILWPPPAPAYA